METVNDGLIHQSLFETKVERMSKFMPKAVELYNVQNFFHLDDEKTVTVESFEDKQYQLCKTNFPSIDGDFYSYWMIVEREKMQHRVGGPASYAYDTATGRLIDIEFYYMDDPLSELEYFKQLAAKCYVRCVNFLKKSDVYDNLYKSEFSYDQFMLRYYYRSGKFAYYYKKKKIPRSTFYKINEQRIARLRV